MAEPARQEGPRQQTALAKRQAQVSTIRDLLEKSKDQIALALPKHLTPERLMRVAMTTIQKNPKLLEADPKTLIGAIIQCAQLGLEPDSVLGHAYLVPFWNSQLGRYDVTFIPGYKGLISLAKRGGEAEHINAVNVYEGDIFKYIEGLNPILEHIPVPPSKRTGPKIGTYAVVKYQSGGRDAIWMWAEEIEIIRDRALATRRINTQKDPREKWGPWGTDEDEMFKKTAIRRLSKLLSLSPEFQKAAALDEMADAGIPQNLDQEVFLGPEGIVSAEMEAIAGRTREKQEELRDKLAARKAEADASGLNEPPPPTDKTPPPGAEAPRQGDADAKMGAGEAQLGAGAAKRGGVPLPPRRGRRSPPQEAHAAKEPPGKTRHEDTETPAGPEAGDPFPEPKKEQAAPAPPAPEAETGGLDKLRNEIAGMVQLFAHNKGWREEGAFNAMLANAGMAFKYRLDQLHGVANKKDLEALHHIAMLMTTEGEGAKKGGGLPFKN